MKITQICCFAVMIATAACEEKTASKTNQPAQPVAKWEKLEEGIDLGKFPPPLADAVGRHAVWVVRVDCTKHKLVALAKSQFQHDSLTADAWATRHKLKLVINAGMFALDHSEHVGFFRIAGVDHSPKVHPEYQSVIAWDTPFSSLSMLDLDEPDKVGEIKKLTQKNLIQNLRLIKHPRENRWQQQPKRWSEAALGVDSKGRALFIFCSQGVSMPQPWNMAGSFTWDIPAKWRVDNIIGTSPEHAIDGWEQVFSIQVGGTITIQKFGRSVTRTTSNVITTN